MPDPYISASYKRNFFLKRKNIYHTPSDRRITCIMRKRKPGYDYSLPEYYFVTMNVHGRVPFIGKIRNGKIVMNEYDEIAARQWFWLYEQYGYITLDVYVIMPDHMHGIVVIHDTRDTRRDNSRVVPTPMTYDPSPSYDIRYNLLSKTINADKTTTSKQIHIAGYNEFKWQWSFHDCIIRYRHELNAVRNYIKNNPTLYSLKNRRLIWILNVLILKSLEI